MSSQRYESTQGPFRADQLRSGDPYELSQGHAIRCAPTGHEGAGPNGLGFAVLDSDPAVKRAGVDTGIELAPGTLRAPDVAVNFVPGDGTWATSAPLAVEYAGKGQDEVDLREKIEELHAGGTQLVWVVRLVGPRRVEVHEKGAPMRVVGAEESLTAPGILSLPVPVKALYDRDAAHAVTFRNLLAAEGYAGLEAVREEARHEAREEALQSALRAVLQARGWTLDAAQDARAAACHDAATLTRWITRAATSARLEEVFNEGADAR